MLGYYENAEATAEAVRDGWLHTGDLGRIEVENGEKRLYVVGRKKEMILAANGENVYPDELEELYRDSPYVKELSIVGLPEEKGPGEFVGPSLTSAGSTWMSTSPCAMMYNSSLAAFSSKITSPALQRRSWQVAATSSNCVGASS